MSDNTPNDEPRERLPRRWWVAGLAVLLVASSGYSLYLAATRPCRFINPEAFERLGEGMTREEVLAAVGLPPGDYTVFRSPPDRQGWAGWRRPVMPQEWQEWWESDRGTILVEFEGARATRCDYWDNRHAPARDALEVLDRLFRGRR